VDGKALRGSGHHPRSPVHLLAVMDHTSRAVLAQADAEATTNEIARFRPLLEGLDLADTVVTADALHTQREQADWLVTAKHAAYLLMVKANQPTLHHQLRRLPWGDIPAKTIPSTAATAGSRSAACRSPPSPASTSRTPPKLCGSPAGPGCLPAGAGGP
jgi:predicted transposase YbfD/YdcC